MKNLIRREQFPYTSVMGWEYDSGDYHTAMTKAMEAVDYKKLRAEQSAKPITPTRTIRRRPHTSATRPPSAKHAARATR